VAEWLAAIFARRAASTWRSKLSVPSAGRRSARWMVRLFSLTVLRMAIFSPEAETMQPVSPTWPPISA
jgi:hypothetical protein